MPHRTEEWSIRDIARLAGTTSRTLRHYDRIGLLPPSRTGANGTRYYDRAALLRLQRILSLRAMGVPLARIAAIEAHRTDPADALRTHLTDLHGERERLDRRIASVRATLSRLQNGAPLMPEEMFDGFDHARHRQEVEERWGKEAWAKSDAWWRALDETEKRAFGEEQFAIARGFAEAMRAGRAPDGDEAQALARRQYAWIATAWNGRKPTAEAFTGLGEMYVADPRFTKTYDAHAPGTAVYVRDAMRAFAERELADAS